MPLAMARWVDDRCRSSHNRVCLVDEPSASWYRLHVRLGRHGRWPRGLDLCPPYSTPPTEERPGLPRPLGFKGYLRAASTNAPPNRRPWWVPWVRFLQTDCGFLRTWTHLQFCSPWPISRTWSSWIATTGTSLARSGRLLRRGFCASWGTPAFRHHARSPWGGLPRARHRMDSGYRRNNHEDERRHVVVAAVLRSLCPLSQALIR